MFNKADQVKKKIAMFKRWKKILSGESVLASSQGLGRIYSITEVRGYYNDLTSKVTDKTLLDDEGIPVNMIATGEKVYAWVNIAQYALGCYDLFLLEGTNDMLDKFLFLAKKYFKPKIKMESGIAVLLLVVPCTRVPAWVRGRVVASY